jgi:flavin reductase (DIM6/NTAB) family NADH-FMN oxidoreductase RutF
MTIEAPIFKQILARWTSGVTVVTTLDEFQWKGMTASSFSSVSLEPPLIQVCLARKLYTHQLIEKSGVFAVNILSTDQLETAKLFAGMYPHIENRFGGLPCGTAVTGCPLLPNALGWLDCKLYAAYAGGDHTIFVGEVLAGTVPHDAPPLLYYQRQWGRFEVLP